MRLHDLVRGFFGRFVPRWTSYPPGRTKLLVFVEGRHDVAFLTRISSILHRDDRHLPDLGALELAGDLILVPTGGGDVIAWASLLAPIGLPEIHLLDREISPVSEARQQAARIVNQRANCRAFVTGKRALENYLHPRCLLEARGLDVDFGDDDDVPDLVAKRCYEQFGAELSWNSLSVRARKRCRERAKRWLNCEAVERTTPERLAQRDPARELEGWLKAIAEWCT